MSRRRQQGAALLVLVTLVVVAASYLLLKQLNNKKMQIEQQTGTAKALASAKAALMGHALGSTVRPGELPCPDTDNDGGSEPTCITGAGLLPWHTLGLEDLRDGSGERLWYALSPSFDGTSPINSDSTATLRIDGGSTEIAAIILAPGEPLPGQNRTAPLPGNIAQYLEDDNANDDNNYVTSATGDFNDRVVVITRDELLQATERRVLGEVRRQLNNYFSDNGVYPFAAAVGDTGQTCQQALSQGLVPLVIGTPPPTGGPCTTPDWSASPSAALPSWFIDDWADLIWYAVAPACTPPACITVMNTASPDNDKQAVLIAGGAKRSGQTRPPAAVTDLLDSAENTDLDQVFEQLPVDAASNDQIRIVAP